MKHDSELPSPSWTRTYYDNQAAPKLAAASCLCLQSMGLQTCTTAPPCQPPVSVLYSLVIIGCQCWSYCRPPPCRDKVSGRSLTFLFRAGIIGVYHHTNPSESFFMRSMKTAQQAKCLLYKPVSLIPGSHNGRRKPASKVVLGPLQSCDLGLPSKPITALS